MSWEVEQWSDNGTISQLCYTPRQMSVMIQKVPAYEVNCVWVLKLYSNREVTLHQQGGPETVPMRLHSHQLVLWEKQLWNETVPQRSTYDRKQCLLHSATQGTGGWVISGASQNCSCFETGQTMHFLISYNRPNSKLHNIYCSKLNKVLEIISTYKFGKFNIIIFESRTMILYKVFILPWYLVGTSGFHSCDSPLCVLIIWSVLKPNLCNIYCGKFDARISGNSLHQHILNLLQLKGA